MRALLPALVLVAAAAHSFAQVPAGGEFRVNTYTTDRQLIPWPAMGADGRFVIVWEGRQGATGPGVFGQRYTADGTPAGAEFRANAQAPGAQERIRPAFGKHGTFLLTWAKNVAPDPFDVYARLFLEDGTPAGPEFRVNVATVDFQYRSAVTSLSNGDFVVAWNNFENSPATIVARRIDRSGAPVGAEFRVSDIADETRFPAVSSWPGGFVIIWRQSVAGGTDIVGRRFNVAGQPLGAQFRANSGNGSLHYPSVAMADSGAFVVAWQDPNGDAGGDIGIEGRLFTAEGTAVGAEFRVNAFTTGQQAFPIAASDGLGNFVVAWTQLDPNSEVIARRFDASGAPRGGDFRVNTYTTNNQVVGVPAMDDVGNFVISWYSQGQDGSLYGAFAQRFGGLRPAAVEVDTASSPQSDGNRVLEVAETVDVRPAWRNLNGAAQAFGGALTSLTGPAGGTYTITDAAGDYGTVANGSTAACSNCYGVRVSASARPTTHWDAIAAESITPDAHGQRKGWRLHVGESFADVPRTSLYYRFVETLLHTGVTSGCSASTYCAQDSTLREQMPVFVLVAREGTGYAPPACTTPVFADVPAGNPFCRWIEELARRGVVAGCGGGNYCPSAPVSREQMSVFILRTLDPALTPPDCTAPVFTDVPADSPFCRWIEELARRNVVGGCGGGRYCPADPVTREQMGVFISQGFGLQLYGP